VPVRQFGFDDQVVQVAPRTHEADPLDLRFCERVGTPDAETKIHAGAAQQRYISCSPEYGCGAFDMVLLSKMVQGLAFELYAVVREGVVQNGESDVEAGHDHLGDPDASERCVPETELAANRVGGQFGQIRVDPAADGERAAPRALIGKGGR